MSNIIERISNIGIKNMWKIKGSCEYNNKTLRIYYNICNYTSIPILPQMLDKIKIYQQIIINKDELINYILTKTDDAVVISKDMDQYYIFFEDLFENVDFYIEYKDKRKKQVIRLDLK
jgi:hypothetical protein